MIKRHLRLLAVRALGSLVIGISLAALTGYTFHTAALYTWPGSIAIALPTAVGLGLLGCGMILLTYLVNGKK